MPFLRESIGGMMVRRDLQLSPSVAQNCFPEYGRRETEFQARPKTAMLPTRGHTRFDAFGPRVVGMAGTREIEERLAVVSGRTLRLYTNPDDVTTQGTRTMLTVAGRPTAFEVTDWPVLGCYAHAANDFLYACADGKVRRRVGGGAVVVQLQPEDWTPRGIAGDRTSGRIWFTSVESQFIRCYTRNQAGGMVRSPEYDLDPYAAGSDVSVQQPESLSYLDGVLAVLDAVGGDVYLFEVQAGGGWSFVSQSGIRNTLSLQFAAGSTDTRRPVHPGGVHLTATEVQVLDRASRRIYRFSRGTGGVRGSSVLNTNVRGVACGFVSGLTTPHVYLDGRQTGGADLYLASGGAALGRGLTDEVPGVETYRPSNIIPLDDSARWMGWVCDRRFHLVDLRNDTVLMNAAGAVDQITASAGRFVGVDRSEGWLKVSPSGAQAPLVGSEDARVKVLEAGGRIQVPGWPRSQSRALRSVYVGARYMLVNQDDFGLVRYDRADLEAAPVRLGATGIYTYVCASGGTRTAGQCVIVSRGTSDGVVDVRWYDSPPTTTAGLAQTAATQFMANRSLGSGIRFNDVVSVACDDDYVFFLFRGSGGVGRRSAVLRRSDGAYVAGLSTIHNINTWGPPANAGYTADGIWGMDMSRGILRATLRSSTSGTATIVRALSRNAETGYSARPEHGINTGLYTQSSALTHDALFLYDIAGTRQTDFELADGTQTRAVTLAAFWVADPYLRSASRWRAGQWQQSRSVAISSLRGRLYDFSGTALRLWESDPQISEGFPFAPVGVRDVGITAPDSISLVEETLYWIGSSRSGGVRCWRIGAESDTAPDANLSQSVEEILDGIGDDVGNAIGWTDDNGGHPTYIVGWRSPGLTLCYDTQAVEWHTRTSLRLAGDTGNPFPWQEAGQGHYRVEVSAQWRDRQYMGGYGAAGGLVVRPSVSDWRDLDGGVVQRVRTFPGTQTERRLVRPGGLRIDTTYGLGDADGDTTGGINPGFTLQVSDDGGRTWGDPRRRSIATRIPPVFYRLGTSRFRAYRIVCEDPVGFTLLGAYVGEPRFGARV